MTRLLADPRTGPFFQPANQQHVKEQLVEQFCALGGGPCVYKGADMKSSHAELDIKKSDFHALVEVLQISMHKMSELHTNTALLRHNADIMRRKCSTHAGIWR